MSTKRGKGERYSTDFKLRLLEEFHAGDSSQYAICKKYGVGYRSFTNWVRKFEAKLPSLPGSLPEVEKRVYMGRVKSKPANQAVPMTEAERLRAEVERLRKVNARLMTAVRRGREDYAEMLEISHASIEYLRKEIATLEAENLNLNIRLGSVN